jgi:hypothetical protein
MPPTGHDIEHLIVVIWPVNAKCFDSAREEWVFHYSVEGIEGPIPVVLVLTEVKINCAENATGSNVAMEGRGKGPATCGDRGIQ